MCTVYTWFGMVLQIEFGYLVKRCLFNWLESAEKETELIQDGGQIKI
jgi:hypothetical protein